MKRVYILRHAKSDYPTGVDDKDRPLSARGIAEAKLIVEYMEEKGYRPDLVYCSAAKRTRMTFEAVSDVFDGQAHDMRDELYLAGAGNLYECLKQSDQGHDSVMFVGHNPGMHNLALFLTAQGAPEHIEELQFKYPTACLAVIDFDVENWEDVRPNTGELRDLMTGKKQR